jgi:hypothetical protein
LPDARLYVDPTLDLDRTMDIGHELLDARCNPRPVFHALRCLNTILHMRRTAWTPEEREERGVRVLSLRSEEGRLELLLPEGSVERAFDAKRLCHLTRATVVANADSALIAGPALVYS